MKRAIGTLAVLAVFVLLSVPAMTAAEEPSRASGQTDSTTLWQTRRNILEALEFGRYLPKCYVLARIDIASVRFTANGFVLDTSGYGCGGRGGSEVVDIRTLESNIKILNWCYLTLLENNGGKPLGTLKTKAARDCKMRKEYKDLYASESEAAKVLSRIWFYDPGSSLTCSADCEAAEKAFVVSMNRLRAIALEKGTGDNDFPQQAAAWRTLSPKPPLPNEVRAQRILAENAVKEKQLLKAMVHYEAGLKLYPTWPQGHFNAALIASELGAYDDAIEQMQAYLELVPNAADAESARDQIVIWREKAKAAK